MFASGFGASSKILNLDAAGFPTHESSQVLLVSVHNIIYPITEYVLHRVFDPYGYVEKMDILQSSELLQAIVQFDSCQNAIWAKNQLQGRYIYERCCQLNIQFYKKIDYEDKTENLLLENAFALDLDFIRNKLHEMMVIIERMQDRMKARNSSSLTTTAAAPLTSATTAPSTPPTQLYAAAIGSSTSAPASTTATTTITSPIPASPLTPSCCPASPTQPHVTATRSAPLFSPLAHTKTSTIIDAQQSSVCYGQKPVALASFKTSQSPLEISINQLGKINNDSLHGSSLYDGIKMQLDCQIFFPEIEQYGHKLFDTMLLGIWCAKLALEHNLRKEQQWTNAHNLFVEMYKLKYEKKILIFDPGGDIFNATCFFAIWSNHAGYNINGHGNKMFNKFDKCISDLEDKVDLEGVGNDTHTTTHRCKEAALLTGLRDSYSYQKVVD